MEKVINALREQANWGVLVTVMVLCYIFGGFDMFLGSAGYTLWVKWDEIKVFFTNIQNTNKKDEDV